MLLECLVDSYFYQPSSQLSSSSFVGEFGLFILCLRWSLVSVFFLPTFPMGVLIISRSFSCPSVVHFIFKKALLLCVYILDRRCLHSFCRYFMFCLSADLYVVLLAYDWEASGFRERSKAKRLHAGWLYLSRTKLSDALTCPSIRKADRKPDSFLTTKHL